MPIAAVCCGLAMDRMHGLRLQETFGAVADYVAKSGRGLARPSWGPGAELGRAHVKSGRGDRYTPFDLLREVLVTGELSGPGQRFRQYDLTLSWRAGWRPMRSCWARSSWRIGGQDVGPTMNLRR